MGSILNPYINFDGRAREAMEYYKTVFGGNLELDTFAGFGMVEADSPDADRIMHGQLETPHGFTLMASDTMTGTPFNPGNNMTVSLSGDDADDLRGFWSALADSGEVAMPLEKAPWGAEFGQLVDRYGVSWMVNVSDPAGDDSAADG